MRVFLFDYRKAFDFIDHGTLAAKLKEVEIPNSIVNWILDFLSDRSQRMKLSRANWSAENLFQLNLEKTKELTISFRRSPEHFDPVTVDGIQVQATTSSKLLGLIINNTLTWNDHVDSLI